MAAVPNDDGGFDLSSAKAAAAPARPAASAQPADDGGFDLSSAKAATEDRSKSLKPSGLMAILDAPTHLLDPIAEPVAKFVSSQAGSAVGGARAIWDVLTGQDLTKATKDIESSQQAMTYQPRTASGKAVESVVGFPGKKLGDVSDRTGERVMRATGSPALGAATDVGMQVAGAILTGKIAGGLGREIAGPAVEPLPTRIEPTISEPQPATSIGGRPSPQPAAAQAAGAAAAQGATTSPGTSPAPTPASPPAANPAPPAGAPAQPQTPPAAGPPPVPPASAAGLAAARQYADAHGLHWDGLTDRVRNLLAHVADSAGNLDGIDPDAVARQSRLERLGVPATRGQVTRDLAQLTREENITKSDAGAPIRDIMADQDRALHEHLNTLRGETGGQAVTRGQLGQSVQGAARSKLDTLRKDYNEEYARAKEQGALQAPANVSPLVDWLKNPTNRRNAGYLQTALNDYLRVGADGAADALAENHITINHLEEVRKEAVANQKTPGPASHFAKEAIKVIDGILADAGPAAYREARAKFGAVKDEFDRQGRVSALVKQKGMSRDRAVALEDTFDQTVLRGSNEQLQAVRETLTTGGTEATRARGIQAWKDMQAATIDYLREKAAGRRVIRGEQGQLQFNSAFIDAVRELDADGKLDTLFGPGASARIREITEAVGDVRTKPTGRIAGSDTTPRLLSWLENLGDLPIVAETTVGRAGRGIARAVRKGVDIVTDKEGQAARKAQTTPLNEAGRRAARRNARTPEVERMAPAPPAPAPAAAQGGATPPPAPGAPSPAAPPTAPPAALPNTLAETQPAPAAPPPAPAPSASGAMKVEHTEGHGLHTFSARGVNGATQADLGAEEREGMLHIRNVTVDAEHRRQGIGSALYDDAIDVARHRGLGLASDGRSVSPEAQRMWQRLRDQGYNVQGPAVDMTRGLASPDGRTPVFSISAEDLQKGPSRSSRGEIGSGPNNNEPVLPPRTPNGFPIPAPPNTLAGETPPANPRNGPVAPPQRAAVAGTRSEPVPPEDQGAAPGAGAQAARDWIARMQGNRPAPPNTLAEASQPPAASPAAPTPAGPISEAEQQARQLATDALTVHSSPTASPGSLHGLPARAREIAEGEVQRRYDAAQQAARDMAPADKQKALASIGRAYERIARGQDGDTNVSLGDIAQQTRIPVPQLQGLLLEEAQAGRAALHSSTSVLHPKGDRAAGIWAPGHEDQLMTVRLKDAASRVSADMERAANLTQIGDSYRAISQEQRGGTVDIADLQERTGIPLEELQGILRAEAKAGRLTLTRNTSVEPSQARANAAGMKVPGQEGLFTSVVMRPGVKPPTPIRPAARNTLPPKEGQ